MAMLNLPVKEEINAIITIATTIATARIAASMSRMVNVTAHVTVHVTLLVAQTGIVLEMAHVTPRAGALELDQFVSRIQIGQSPLLGKG